MGEKIDSKIIMLPTNFAGKIPLIAFYFSILIICGRFLLDRFGSNIINIAYGTIIILSLFSVSVLFKGSFVFNNKGIKMILYLVIVLNTFTFIHILLNKSDIYLYEYLRVMMLFSIYFLISQVLFISNDLKNHFEKVLYVYFCFQFLLVAIGIFNIIVGNYFTVSEGEKPRVDSTFGHPNHYGQYLVILISFIYVVIKQIKYKQLLIILSILSLIVYTQIFNFAAILYIAVFAFFMYVQKQNSRLILLRLILFVGLGVGIFYFLLKISDQFAARVTILYETNLINIDKEYPTNSFQWRIFMWQYALENVEDPFLGNGIGSSTYFFKFRTHSTNFAVLDLHNEFLRIYFEYGICGLMVLFLFLRNIYLRISHESKAVLTGFLVSCATSNYFRATDMMIHIFLIISFIEYKNKKLQQVSS